MVQVRELIYREILEYHPHMLADYVSNRQQTSFVYPSAVDNFKRQFAHLEGGGVPGRVPGHNGNLGQVCICACSVPPHCGQPMGEKQRLFVMLMEPHWRNARIHLVHCLEAILGI